MNSTPSPLDLSPSPLQPELMLLTSASACPALARLLSRDRTYL